MAGRGRNSSAAGGPARHIPVMLSEVLKALEPKDGEIIVDGTRWASDFPAVNAHESWFWHNPKGQRVTSTVARRGGSGPPALHLDSSGRPRIAFATPAGIHYASGDQHGRTLGALGVVERGEGRAVIGFRDPVAAARARWNNQREVQFGMSPADRGVLARAVAEVRRLVGLVRVGKVR